MKILAIEDSKEIVDFIRIAIKVGWPECELFSAIHGRQGVDMIELESPDVVILDLGLPDMDGFDVLEKIREFSNVPVIILTVRGDEPFIVKGLELGADDYIIKPFKQLELLARIKAVTRRREVLFSGGSDVVGPLKFNESAGTVIYKGKQIHVTRTETAILRYLSMNAGHVVVYEKLAELIWGDKPINYSSTLTVYIRRIRQKLESNPSTPEIILNKHGIGYVFNVT